MPSDVGSSSSDNNSDTEVKLTQKRKKEFKVTSVEKRQNSSGISNELSSLNLAEQFTYSVVKGVHDIVKSNNKKADSVEISSEPEKVTDLRDIQKQINSSQNDDNSNSAIPMDIDNSQFDQQKVQGIRKNILNREDKIRSLKDKLPNQANLYFAKETADFTKFDKVSQMTDAVDKLLQDQKEIIAITDLSINNPNDADNDIPNTIHKYETSQKDVLTKLENLYKELGGKLTPDVPKGSNSQKDSAQDVNNSNSAIQMDVDNNQLDQQNMQNIKKNILDREGKIRSLKDKIPNQANLYFAKETADFTKFDKVSQMTDTVDKLLQGQKTTIAAIEQIIANPNSPDNDVLNAIKQYETSQKQVLTDLQNLYKELGGKLTSDIPKGANVSSFFEKIPRSQNTTEYQNSTSDFDANFLFQRSEGATTQNFSSNKDVSMGNSQGELSHEQLMKQMGDNRDKIQKLTNELQLLATKTEQDRAKAALKRKATFAQNIIRKAEALSREYQTVLSESDKTKIQKYINDQNSTFIRLNGYYNDLNTGISLLEAKQQFQTQEIQKLVETAPIQNKEAKLRKIKEIIEATSTRNEEISSSSSKSSDNFKIGSKLKKFDESSQPRNEVLTDIRSASRIDEADDFIPRALRNGSYVRDRLFQWRQDLSDWDNMLQSKRNGSFGYEDTLLLFDREIPINSSIGRYLRRSDIIDNTLNNIVIFREILTNPTYRDEMGINTNDLCNQIIDVEKAFEKVLQECKRASTYLEMVYNVPGNTNALDRLLRDSRNITNLQDPAEHPELSLGRSLHELDRANSLLDSRLEELERWEEQARQYTGKGKDRANW